MTSQASEQFGAGFEFELSESNTYIIDRLTLILRIRKVGLIMEYLSSLVKNSYSGNLYHPGARVSQLRYFLSDLHQRYRDAGKSDPLLVLTINKNYLNCKL